MKKVLMIAMALMLCAGSVMAAPGADHIGLYTDNVNMNQCYLNNPLPAFPNQVALYVVHKFALTVHGGAKGSQFFIKDNSGFISPAATPIAPFLPIGGPFTDWTLAYASCIATDAFAIATYTAYATAVPSPCQTIQILPAPSAGSGQVESIDCNDVSATATGGTFHFSPDASCTACDEPNQVPVEKSTWGKVKSLYR